MFKKVVLFVFLFGVFKLLVFRVKMMFVVLLFMVKYIVNDVVVVNMIGVMWFLVEYLFFVIR